MKLNINQSVGQTQRRRRGKVVMTQDGETSQVQVLFDDGEYEWIPSTDLEIIPDQLRLSCGCDVPHEIGQPIYNYYDMKAGEITRLARYSEPDHSGTDEKGMSFPDGKAWWVDTTAGFVDGSRMCCQAFAKGKGWLDS